MGAVFLKWDVQLALQSQQAQAALVPLEAYPEHRQALPAPDPSAAPRGIKAVHAGLWAPTPSCARLRRAAVADAKLSLQALRVLHEAACAHMLHPGPRFFHARSCRRSSRATRPWTRTSVCREASARPSWAAQTAHRRTAR